MSDAYFLFLCSPGERAPAVHIDGESQDGNIYFYEREKGLLATFGVHINDDEVYDHDSVNHIRYTYNDITLNKFHAYVTNEEEFNWKVFKEHRDIINAFSRAGYLLKVYE